MGPTAGGMVPSDPYAAYRAGGGPGSDSSDDRTVTHGHHGSGGGRSHSRRRSSYDDESSDSNCEIITVCYFICCCFSCCGFLYWYAFLEGFKTLRHLTNSERDKDKPLCCESAKIFNPQQGALGKLPCCSND